MKDNLHLKKYKIEELPTDLVEEIRRTFQIFDVDNGKTSGKVNGIKCRVLKMDGPKLKGLLKLDVTKINLSQGVLSCGRFRLKLRAKDLVPPLDGEMDKNCP